MSELQENHKSNNHILVQQYCIICFRVYVYGSYLLAHEVVKNICL